MDEMTKRMSLARNAMLHVEHARKKRHDGAAAIDAKGGKLDMKAAYEAAGKGSDMRGITGALNPAGGMPVNDEPGMRMEVPNASYCISYEELMPAVNRRITVGDQLQPTPMHAGFQNIGMVLMNTSRDIDDAGF